MFGKFCSTKELRLRAVSQACNTSYLKGWEWEDHSLRPAWANSSRDPISKMDWRYGSSSRATALQVQSPEFKNLNPIIKRKRERKRKNTWSGPWLFCNPVILGLCTEEAFTRCQYRTSTLYKYPSLKYFVTATENGLSQKENWTIFLFFGKLQLHIILVRFFQRNKKIFVCVYMYTCVCMYVYVCIYIWGKLLKEIGSWDYGGWQA
jgi:hypothetical protein